MFRTRKIIVAALLAAAVVAFTWLTRPKGLDPAKAVFASPDVANGELIFHAGGCTSCHGERLEGGLELETDFGTFHVPNISPDPDTGTGNWSDLDMINAMMFGTSPSGKHYYPAFPFTSYTRMKTQDVVDLKAYIDTLEPISRVVPPHKLGFPWNWRRAIGLWKLKYLKQGPVVIIESEDPAFVRGRYLAEGPGHCGECHTPRDSFGGLRLEEWLAGGPNPDGEGKVPNITPHADGLESWSQSDIAYFLESGFTPDFDTVGGSMVKVQEHMALLPGEDREAIALYLKSVPAVP